MMAKSEVQTPQVSKSDIDWINQRMDRMDQRHEDMRKRMHLMMALMVEKKVCSPEMAKVIEETVASEEADVDVKLKWLLEQI